MLFEGRDLLKLSADDMRAIRGRDISMIFQEPMTSLNPVLSIGEQIMEPLFIHLKMTDAQAKARAIELLQLVGITDGERRLQQYPHQLSGGMRQRVMIAIGLACNPKLIIADEPTTALDVTIQAQILELMKELSRRLNIALIIITHNLGVVARYADRVNVMYAAHIIEHGTADDVFLRPLHPYTIGLMRSVPRLDLPRGVKLETIEGLPPDLRSPPPGCRFAPRCPYRLDACVQTDVILRDLAPGHGTACIRADEIVAGALVQPGPPAKSAAAASTTESAEPILKVDALRKYFAVPLSGTGFFSSKVATVKAVDDVSFTIAPGETLGLVGESGCGKTTVGRTVLKLEEPTEGTIRFTGVDITHRTSEADAGTAPRHPGDLPGPVFVAQPAHDRRPDHRRAAACLRAGQGQEGRGGARRRSAAAGRPVRLHGGALSAPVVGRPAPARRHRARARARAALHRLRRAGVGARRLDPGPDHQPARRPAVAAQALSYLFIAHDLAVVRHISDRVAVMYLGRIAEVADRDELYADPKHPYTKALLDAAPIPDPRVERARAPRALKGEIPSPLNPPSGCVFHTRCPIADEECRREIPQVRQIGPRHIVACHKA